MISFQTRSELGYEVAILVAIADENLGHISLPIKPSLEHILNHNPFYFIKIFIVGAIAFGTSKHLALRPSVSETCPYPLHDHLALELGAG
jgi:hypothetical protein